MLHVNLDLDVEQSDGERLLRLHAGEGEAHLRVLPAGSKDRHHWDRDAYGDAFLSAPDRQRGAAFVRNLATWLGLPLEDPREPPGELGPFPCSYIRSLADEGEHLQVGMDDWSRGSRLDLFIDPAQHQCMLLPGFVQERELRALSIALRDGWPLPRRTPGQDPLLARAEPLVPALRPLPGSRGLSNPAWVGRELVGAVAHDGEQHLCRWRDPREPPARLWTFRGYPAELSPSPDGRLLALTIFHWGDDGTASGAEGSVLLVPLGSGGQIGEVIPLTRSGEGFTLSFAGLTWSPAGDRLAVRGTDRRRRPPLDEVIRLFDVASRELVAIHWRPRRAEPRRAEPHVPESALPAWAVRTSFPYRGLAYGSGRSPDGAYELELDDDVLVVTDREGGRRKLVLERDRDREALRNLELQVSWIGGSSLHLVGEEHYVLDLRTLKLSYYLPPLPLGASWWSESPDQGLVLVQRRLGPVRSGDLVYLWGEVAWP